MKKLIIAAFIAVAITGSAFAKPTETTTETVSYRVLNSFKADFADAENVSWKIDKDFVKASFILENEKMEAFYNNDGELIATSKAIAFDKLPKKALKTITTKYPFPPYSLEECIELTNAAGVTNYYVNLKKGSEKLPLEMTKTGDVSEFKKGSK